MRRTTGVALGLALALAAGVGGWVALRDAPDEAPAAVIALCTIHRPGRRAGARAASTRWTAQLLGAVGRVLTPSERASLAAALDDALARWEARANPLVEDLGDGSPDAPLEAWTKDAPPAVDTALTMAREEWCAADGLCVRVVSATAPCPAGFARPRDARERGRARFLAWPWGHALRVRADDPAAAARAAEALRAWARAKESPVAFILTSDDAAAAGRPPLVALRDRFVRRRALTAIAAATERAESPEPPEPREDATAEVALGERDVVVVPRLTGVGDDERVLDEVRRRAPAAIVAPVVPVAR